MTVTTTNSSQTFQGNGTATAFPCAFEIILATDVNVYFVNPLTGAQTQAVLNTDYTITGAGWIGIDRSTKWDAALVLSPRLAQEIQKDYRMLRYMLDRRNRLSISFRVDGTVPNIKIRLESRILAQLLRGTAPSRDSGTDEPAGDSTNKRKNWLPDALERFLKR